MNKAGKTYHTSVVKEEFIKWFLSLILVILAAAFTVYVYKTDKLPFFGSLTDKETEKMLEEHKDELEEKEAEEAEIQRMAAETLKAEQERDKNGSNEVDLHKILDGSTENTNTTIEPKDYYSITTTVTIED